MKLHLQASTTQYVFTGYGDGYVMLNNRRIEANLVVLPDNLIENWDASGFDALSAEHFEYLASLKPELVLLGTGARLRFPHPRLTRALTQSGIGLEIMDTHAACRTYNILQAEGRRVAAALLLG